MALCYSDYYFALSMLFWRYKEVINGCSMRAVHWSVSRGCFRHSSVVWADWSVVYVRVRGNIN